MTPLCIMCNKECGTAGRQMHYIAVTGSPAREIEPFCSEQCARQYAAAYPDMVRNAPRCSSCGRIIINAPWYAGLHNTRPMHFECLPECKG